MAYQLPSVLVYEELASSGGVANTTPDLNACIIGPCYNVLTYDPTSVTTLIATAALAAATATGSMTAGSTTLTLTAASPFFAGDVLLVPGATSAGSTMQATVVSVSFNVVTLDTAAGTAVTNVTINKTGSIADNQVTNTFILPNQLAGQVIDPTTVQVYVNNTQIETLATQFDGVSGVNTITIAPATGTGATTASSDQITGVANAAFFTIGDPITVTGAGASGATLSTTITEIVGETITMAVTASTTVASATVTKAAVSNINSNTSTLRMEAGDAVVLQYTNTSDVAATFTTSVVSVVNLTGTIETVTLADVLPANLSFTTTLSANAAVNATSITLTSASGYSVGDTIVIPGALAGQGTLYATISAISTNTLTISPAIGYAVTAGTVTYRQSTVTLRTRKVYNNQLLAQTYNSYTNYNDSTVATTGELTIEPQPQLAFGTLITGDVYIAYNALRTDLSGAIQEIASTGDLTGILGTPSPSNPLSLGVQLAMANATTSSIYAIAVPSADLLGYQTALEMAEGMMLYALTPLTQELDILDLFQEHVDQMSTPQMASWRMALMNTAIPTTQNIGQYNVDNVNTNSGNNTITVISGNYVLTASNATFMSDGVNAGDLVNVVSGTGSPSPIGTMTVLQVISNQQIAVQASGTAVAVGYYVTRNLTKTQQAAAVAAQSTTWGDSRVVHVQPDLVGITVNGVDTYLPGYYLACCLTGLIAGLPVQQGLTNTAPAGINDVQHSNFYFTRAQMDTMAAAGTCLLAQLAQSSSPYVRHELTTDMTVLEYREIQQVKNIDFLAYYFYGILKGFIGKWNITKDSLNTLRQTIVAGAGLLMGQSLPKLGPPLVSYSITSIAQDTVNLDTVDIVMPVQIPTVMNYINLYLTV
jgi:hypothetical protein